MTSEVTLTIRDDSGDSRSVVVHSNRFTIGRTPDNDLAIEHSSLSRRHAVIENFEGIIQISDCGSQNGTEVNGAPITAGCVLNDGDWIVLGGVCEIEVQIRSDAGEKNSKSTTVVSQPAATAKPAIGSQKRKVVQPAATGSGSFTGVHLAMISVGLLIIVLALGLLIFILTRGGPAKYENRQVIRNDNQNSQIVQDASPQVTNTNETQPDSNNQVRDTSLNLEQLETSASGVILKLSSDDKPYGFSEKALQDIGKKVNQYKGSSSLPGNLAAIQRSGAAIGAMARHEGMEPGLLIYVVLAELEEGRGGDPRAVAQSVIGDLSALRATFGTNDADSSLLLLAAYKMGRGDKRSHPLLATLRKVVKNPLTQRNVWYLNDRGGLTPQSYDFVLTVVALGAISQDPSQFGMSASPLVF